MTVLVFAQDFDRSADEVVLKLNERNVPVLRIERVARMTEDWRVRAEGLADKLTADGDLCTAEWRAAVCAVPRHELVPRYYEPEGTTYHLVTPDDHASRRAWLDLVYSDTTLVTAVVADPSGCQVPVSSSTKPDLMVRMLEALDIRDGHKVLEIGTGTGYNAALLSHRLGPDKVFSIDLRPELVDDARNRLATVGYRPVLRTGDGSQGLRDHAPYDRIIATCSVATIPPEWIEQTAPGGLILVDVEGQLSAGNLVALRRGDEPVAEGKFLGWYGRFMALRHDAASVGQPWPSVDRSHGEERTTAVHPVELDGEFRFLAQFRLPPGTRHTLTVDDGAPTATCLTHRDGSWCSVDRTADESGQYRVRHAGPQDLWADVEHAHDEWATMGAPRMAPLRPHGYAHSATSMAGQSRQHAHVEPQHLTGTDAAHGTDRQAGPRIAATGRARLDRRSSTRGPGRERGAVGHAQAQTRRTRRGCL